MTASDVLSPLRLAVLISGAGTTLKNLLDRIDSGRLDARIDLIISSSPTAGGLKFASDAGIESHVVQRRDYESVADYGRGIFDHCRRVDPHAVAMGGFLKLVEIPEDFAGRVLNIHPALIPSFCGQGLYGLRVHQAVLDAGCKVSGCTVHFVDNQYDHGPIILQRAVAVEEDDTAETLAARVFQAECEAYPEALTLFAQRRLGIEGGRVRVLPEQ